jgi:hypothetical protein
VLAPEGEGTFRHARFDDIRTLDPDLLVFADPAMRATIGSEPWRSLRAVRAHRVLIAPGQPFGWVDEPPSINRLAGLMWLGGSDAGTAGAIFNSVVYGRVFPVNRSTGCAQPCAPPNPERNATDASPSLGPCPATPHCGSRAASDGVRRRQSDRRDEGHFRTLAEGRA